MKKENRVMTYDTAKVIKELIAIQIEESKKTLLGERTEKENLSII